MVLKTLQSFEFSGSIKYNAISSVCRAVRKVFSVSYFVPVNKLIDLQVITLHIPFDRISIFLLSLT